MATVTEFLVPVSDVSIGLLVSPGPVHYTAVDNFPSYVTSQYVYENTSVTNPSNDLDIFAVSNTILTHPTIISVILGARVKYVTNKGGANAQVRLSVITHSTQYDSTLIEITDSAYRNKSFTWETNPFTGVAWTKAEADDLQIVLRLYADKGTQPVQTTTAAENWVKISWDDAPLVIYPAMQPLMII